MAFQRWQPFLGTTLAIQLFRRHQTHLNATFWAHFVARKHAYASTKTAKPTDNVSTVFTATGSNAHFNWTLEEWATNYEDFDRWSRLATILAVAGYLETFLAQIISAALESSPAIIIGGAKELDGVAQLKRQSSYSFFQRVEPVVRGDWNQRVSNYKALFRSCPFEAEKDTLEKLRKLRNNAGHSFGRDISSLQFAERSLVTRLQPIPDERIIAFLSSTDRVARAVENHLGQFIGCYEIIRAYHFWKQEKKPAGSRGEIGKLFSTYTNEITGSPIGKNAAVTLIDFYDKA